MTPPPTESLAAKRIEAAQGIPERVRALLPEIAAYAEETERQRRIAAPLVAAMLEAGLFRMLLPRPFNGFETDPLTFTAAIEEIAKADASTAWSLCQTAVCAMVAAYLPPETAMEIFGRDPKAVLAWGPGPNGRAVATRGGYRVTGNFAFASGGRHATWLGAHVPVYDLDGSQRRTPAGAPVVRTVLFPAAAAPMKDIWHVVGLRGTGSDAFDVDDLFVPETHTLGRDDPADRRYPGPLYALPTNSLYSCGFASLALGVARALLDAFVALAMEKTPRGYKHTLRNSAVTQTEIAEAEARLRAARMYLRGTLDEVWQSVERTNSLSIEQRMAMRLAASQALKEAAGVADFAYHAAGATAIFESNPFERRFRDMHAITQQLQGRRSHFETVGKYLLDVEFDQAFL
ncbi:MAG TPA: acyl-CoA dehydrogenase family protein [Stellaceae bacterium]|nr:acyl-CoA dehydrogenase family protein [Stellaceae bacterium]